MCAGRWAADESIKFRVINSGSWFDFSWTRFLWGEAPAQPRLRKCGSGTRNVMRMFVRRCSSGIIKFIVICVLLCGSPVHPGCSCCSYQIKYHSYLNSQSQLYSVLLPLLVLLFCGSVYLPLYLRWLVLGDQIMQISLSLSLSFGSSALGVYVSPVLAN